MAQDHQGQWTWALSGRPPGTASNPEAKDLGESWAKILISFMPIRMISELYTQRQRDVYMGFDCCHILNGHKYTHGYSRRDRWDRYQREIDGRGQRDSLLSV